MLSEPFPDEYTEFVRQSIETWKTFESTDIEFTKLHSYSNDVYKLSTNKDAAPKNLIFRVFKPLFFGQSKEAFGYLSLTQEKFIFSKISETKFGPECLATNDKYRIEEYLDYSIIPFDAIKSQDIRRLFVLWIVQFNKLNLEILKTKEAAYHKYYSTINLNEISDILDSKKATSTLQIEQIDQLKKMYTQESLDFLIKEHPTDLVLCHGDLNYSNILYSKQTERVILIDYERAGYSLKADDIGCFIFNGLLDVYSGDFKEYPENFPSNEVIRELAELYTVYEDIDLLSPSIHDKLHSIACDIKEYIEKNYSSSNFNERVAEIMKNIKLSLMNCAFCNCYGSLKFNFIPDPAKSLAYQYACSNYFNKVFLEYAKSLN